MFSSHNLVLKGITYEQSSFFNTPTPLVYSNQETTTSSVKISVSTPH